MALPTQIVARLVAVGASPEQVTEKFVRGAGPGGQKINKTSSTVWLRHGPSGIEVRCQRERSQASNRVTAWLELCAKLELRVKKVSDAAIDRREEERRRTRQKSRRQKVRMIESKKHRAQSKSRRGKVNTEG